MVKSFGNTAVKLSSPHRVSCHSRTCRVSALIHKVRDNAVENKLIVVIHIGKPDEILNALLSLLREKLYLYFTEILNCQFYIVNTDPGEYELGGTRLEDGSVHYYETFEEAGMTQPKNVQELYKEYGGTPFLDGSYTVFGQVFEGMDVVRAMGQVETDENDKPLTQVQMESVRIVEYTGE